MGRSPAALLVVAAVAVVLAPVVGCSATADDDTIAKPIQGGETDHDDPAVGLIHYPGGGFCTGTLIAPDIVLTAGHCVTKPSDFFFTGTGVETKDYKSDASIGTMTPHEVLDIQRYPTFTHFQTCPNPALDIGLIRLKEPITDITPLRFGGTPFVGMTCRAIGFGTHTVLATDAGTRDDDAATDAGGDLDAAAEASGGENGAGFTVDAGTSSAVGDAGDPSPAPGEYFEGKRTAAETVIALGDGFIQVRYGTGIADHGDSGGPLLCDGSIMGTTSCHNDGDVPAHQIEYYARVDQAFDWVQARIATWEDPDAGPSADGGIDAASDAGPTADAGIEDAAAE